MTQEEIKTGCEYLRSEIEIAKARIRQLQEWCSHENTFEGNWSYRIGNISPAIMCSDCGSFIKYKDAL